MFSVAYMYNSAQWHIYYINCKFQEIFFNDRSISNNMQYKMHDEIT